MSESIPERADVRQLRIQAKELFRALQSGDIVADGVLAATAKLADAQRLTARKYGFDSWPKLVEQVETPALIERFKQLVGLGDADGLEKLLRKHSAVRARINDPIFSFDSPAVVAASGSRNSASTVPVLVRYGADPNARSGWWAGSFGALDGAKGDTVEVLLSLGAKFDVWSAAAHGRLDVLKQLLDEDPTRVNAPGGDGERPLHFAANAEVAEFLIARGADLEQRDVDHESTPIQHHINDSELLRCLLKHGAIPDIFTAAALNDPALARSILAANPNAANSCVGKAPFVTTKSNGGHTYTYRIGPAATPVHMAAHLGHREVLAVLLEAVPASTRLIAAAWLEDAKEVAAILTENPEIGKEMGAEARAISDAAQQGKTEAVRLFLTAGLDPCTPGMDTGSALHLGCWYGWLDVVKLLVGRVPLDLLDASHGSPPLGWACHGSQWCGNPAGDYVGVVTTLLGAGADPNVSANREGATMLQQAGAREDVKSVLRQHGAK